MPEPSQKPVALREWFFQSKASLVAANLGWQFATKAASTLLALVAVGLVARSLGPERLGLYRNVQAVAGLLGALATLVSNQVLVHRMITEPAKEGWVLGSAMVVTGTCGLLLFLAAALVPWSFDGLPARGEMLAAGSMLALLFMVPMAAWFEARMAGRLLAVSNLSGQVLTRIWEVSCALLGAGVVGFAFSQPAGLTLMTVVVLWQFRRSGGEWKDLGWNKGVAVSVVVASVPWAVLTFVLQTQMRLELFFLTGLSGVGEAGRYSAALELLQPFLILPGFLLSALFPSVVRSYATARALGEARLMQYLRLSAAAGILCAAGLCLLAGWVVPLIYGAAFETSVPVLRVLAWMLVPVFLASPCQAWLVQEKLGWLAVVMAGGGLLLSVTLNVLLIPRFGIMGAAWTAATAIFLGQLIVCACHPRTRALAGMQLRALAWPVPSIRKVISG